MFCTKCGATLPDGSTFCTSCGAQLGAPAQQPAQPQMQQPMQPQMQQPMQPQYAAPAPAPKATTVYPKAALGLTVGALAAIAAFSGMVSVLATAVIALYVFLKEDNAWLKKQVVKVLAFVVIIEALLVAMGAFFDLFTWIYNWGALFDSSALSKMVSVTDRIESILRYVVRTFEYVMLFVAALGSFKMKPLKFPVIDGIVENHMD